VLARAQLARGLRVQARDRRARRSVRCEAGTCYMHARLRSDLRHCPHHAGATGPLHRTASKKHYTRTPSGQHTHAQHP
jgi:hypothetical protein